MPAIFVKRGAARQGWFSGRNLYSTETHRAQGKETGRAALGSSASLSWDPLTYAAVRNRLISAHRRESRVDLAVPGMPCQAAGREHVALKHGGDVGLRLRIQFPGRGVSKSLHGREGTGEGDRSVNSGALSCRQL